MKQIFNDVRLNSKFISHGYCVVENFIQEREIGKLEEIFYRYLDKSNLDIPFFTTHWSSNDAYRNEVHHSVNSLLFPHVSNLLPLYKSIFGYYLVKTPGGGNRTTIHQDWTLCNENEHTGLTLWCPLADVNLQNGCFQVVDGSHLFYNNVRGTNIESPYSTFGNSIEEKYLTSLEIKKGDAIFFDHRLMHASPPNLTNNIRIAAGMVLLPQTAQVEHYLKEGETIHRYQCDDDFLHSFYYNYKNPGKALFDKSRYKLLELFPYQSRIMSPEEFEMSFFSQ